MIAFGFDPAFFGAGSLVVIRVARYMRDGGEAWSVTDNGGAFEDLEYRTEELAELVAGFRANTYGGPVRIERVEA